MDWWLILLLIFQFKSVLSIIYQQTDSQSISKENVIHVEDGIPSKIACVHKCMYLQANALYSDLKCRCIKKESNKDINGDTFVTGTYLEKKEVNKGLPKRGYCVIKVLSIDSLDSNYNNGAYFHFYRATIGLGLKEKKVFVVKNLRSGRIDKAKVWGEPHGGSIGDSHGRYETGVAKNGDWQTGDYVMIMEEVQSCQKKLWFALEYCVIKVLSIDSLDSNYNNGAYFHFYRATIGLGLKEKKVFVVKNLRSGRIDLAKVWGEPHGGSIGDSHGRYETGVAKNGDWQTGDYVMIIEEGLNCQEKLLFGYL